MVSISSRMPEWDFFEHIDLNGIGLKIGFDF